MRTKTIAGGILLALIRGGRCRGDQHVLQRQHRPRQRIGASRVVTQSLNVKNKGKLKDVNLGVALQTFENSDHALSGKRMKRVGGP